MDFSFLNNDQLKAVKAPIDRPVKISAGAGTGKTTVLTARYLELLNRGYKIESLLALTFTRKAAAEMRTRIFQSLDDPHDILKASITNFDSFFLSILTSNTFVTGLDRSVRILENAELMNVKEEVFEDIRMNTQLPEVSVGRLDRILDTAFSAVNEARLNLISPDKFKNNFGSSNSVPPLMGEIASNLFTVYEEALKDIPALDFPLISLLCYELLSYNKELRNDINRRFRYILLDEVQDTNPAQFKILQLIADTGMKNVTAVGDDKQSIYGFRGADIDNIREFDGEEYPLTVNFRSPEPILNLGHKLICMDEYFAERADKIKLSADQASSGNEVRIFSGDSLMEEAEFAALKISEFIKQGIDPSEIAILSRTKAPLKLFESTLKKRGIPNRTIGGSYFDREEIKDILAVIQHAVSGGKDASAGARLRVRRMSSVIENLSNEFSKEDVLNRNSLADSIAYILKKSGYLLYVSTGDNSERAFANIDKLIEMCERYSTDDSLMTIDDFVGRLQNDISIGREEIEAEYIGKPSVSLLSIHQAKGLEWSVVFAVNFKEKRRLSRPDFVYNKDFTNLIFRTDPVADEEIPEFADALQESETMEKMEAEEIRLNYVAVTRAKKVIFITGQKLDWLVEYLGDDLEFTIEEKSGNLFSSVQSEPISEIDYEGIFRNISERSDALKSMVDADLFSKGRTIDLNFTALRDYLHCPKYYYYRHVVKIAEVENAAAVRDDEFVSSANLGDVFHKIAALDPRLEYGWRRNLEKTLTVEEIRTLSEYNLKSLEMFFDNYRKLELHRTNILMTERKFAVLLKSNGLVVRFSGVIDRIEAVQDKIRLLDFKTGKVDSPEKREEFALQLSSYALAVRENSVPGMTGCHRLTIAAIHDGKLLDVDQRIDVKDIILDTAVKISANDYPAMENKTCDNCPFAGLC